MISSSVCTDGPGKISLSKGDISVQGLVLDGQGLSYENTLEGFLLRQAPSELERFRKGTDVLE
jgi:hypothetical protein